MVAAAWGGVLAAGDSGGGGGSHGSWHIKVLMNDGLNCDATYLLASSFELGYVCVIELDHKTFLFCFCICWDKCLYMCVYIGFFLIVVWDIWCVKGSVIQVGLVGICLKLASWMREVKIRWFWKKSVWF